MPASIRITSAGNAKLKAILEAARKAGAKELYESTLEARKVAAATAPSPEEEARMVSIGTPDDLIAGRRAAGRDLRGFASSGLVGTNEGGRYIWAEGTMPIQKAIAEDPVAMKLGSDEIRATTGHAKLINQATGFSWITRHRGLQGPTRPFNKRFLEALEFGGVWQVKPRRDNKQGLLEPEDGLLTTGMTKTVGPHGMYHNARIFMEGRRIAIMNAIRAAVRGVE
jgi:hypothetical protein